MKNYFRWFLDNRSAAILWAPERCDVMMWMSKKAVKTTDI